MTKFIPGLELSKLFYQKEIKPILDKEFSKLKYSAALFGWGSEVLGYDTEISRDHHWGPRVFIFLSEKDYPKLKDKIHKAIANNLPYDFMGYSTNYSKPAPNGVRRAIKITSGPVDHMVNVYTVKSFYELRLRFDQTKNITVENWLTFPQQRLLEMVSGEVFYDGLGELKKVREKFSYYPKDVWLYMLACQWIKISQEEAFVGRAGDVGDELGSQIVAARIVREIMKLCFLMEKRYYPYSKWFGAAFGALKISKNLAPVLRKVLVSKNWKEREKWLAQAYEIVAKNYNALKITKPLSSKVSSYYGRPYLVIHADVFAEAIKKVIKDPRVKGIKTNIGSVDQFTDSTDVVENLKLCEQLEFAYKRD
ncbi:MAG: DUF4037 domain-containing protein [Candidatus Doudnabacteria bacterium]|nr:DUF4037 domain-containing protein [Candidatus Doudnabacteria bacterium]